MLDERCRAMKVVYLAICWGWWRGDCRPQGCTASRTVAEEWNGAEGRGGVVGVAGVVDVE